MFIAVLYLSSSHFSGIYVYLNQVVDSGFVLSLRPNRCSTLEITCSRRPISLNLRGYSRMLLESRVERVILKAYYVASSMKNGRTYTMSDVAYSHFFGFHLRLRAMERLIFSEISCASQNRRWIFLLY